MSDADLFGGMPKEALHESSKQQAKMRSVP